jgi:predicted nucleotidyltransferase
MDTTSSNLIGIARRLADACAAAQSVQAVAVTGSVAAGTADDASDLDLIVLHTALPERAALNEIRVQVNGSKRLCSSSVQDTARFKEGYFVDGIRCDLSHLTHAAIEDDLALVLNAHSTDSHAQSRVAGVQRCLPLFGDNLVQGCQNKAAHYPAELWRKMVETYLSFQPFWVMTEMGVKRGDLLFCTKHSSTPKKPFSASSAA